MEYDAELHNYEENHYSDTKSYYTGNIYADTKGRFCNGAIIRTSLSVKVEDGILHTLNTRYKLVNKPEGNTNGYY
jgi:hypothetical protein